MLVEWPCEQEESEGADIASFFTGGGGSSAPASAPAAKKRRRTEYFHTRKMKHITSL